MFSSLRLAMTWLHTWFGLFFGFVLVVIFFFGSLSVFDREIDRWAVPETRFEPQIMPSFDTKLRPVFEQIEPDEAELAEARGRVGGKLEATLPVMNWGAYTTHRDPMLSMYSEFAIENNPNDRHDHVHGRITIDPRSGKALAHDQLNIGSHFFFPMHYMLHLHWKDFGYYLVGIAALMMLVALVSGAVIHRKFFREFFTFRPSKNTRRSTLDLHNLTGVVALPFHFMFALTGLIIFAGIYFPVSETLLKPLAEKHGQLDAQNRGLPFESAGVEAPLASVDAMVVEAKQRWKSRGMPGEVGFLTVTHVGDANSYVSIYRAGSDRVALVGQAVHFAGPTGKVIYEEPPPSAVISINEFLTGLHLQHFEHWLLRWFYVFGGLSGCVCIATGLIFFVGKRREKHAAQGKIGALWVDAMAVTAVTGMLLATLSILVASQLLPADLKGRELWEERVFWAAWVLSFLHAALRTITQRGYAVRKGLAPTGNARYSPAWREQTALIALLGLAAPVVNWITTGDHLARTITRGYWPVAGLDLALLAVAGIATVAALGLARNERIGLNTSEQDSPILVESSRGSAHG